MEETACIPLRDVTLYAGPSMTMTYDPLDTNGVEVDQEAAYQQVLDMHDAAKRGNAEAREYMKGIKVVVVPVPQSSAVCDRRRALVSPVMRTRRTHRSAFGTRTARKTTARRGQAHSASTRSSSCDDSGGGEPPHPPGFPPSAVEPTHGHRKPVAR